MINKPQLTFWQIWNMSFGFLGIQFGFALQNANVSRIFQSLGADVDQIPILWLAAPITGLIIQPIIGYMSDRTWSRIGRRRPYFLVGAILASLALLIMPNSPALWVAAGVLWILDASINISMEPFRALVADMLPNEQRDLGFSVQTFFIGVGSVIASMLPYILTNWLGVSSEVTGNQTIPESVEISFYLGAFAFITAVVWTVIKTKEYPPEDFRKQFEGVPEFKGGFRHGASEIWHDFKAMPKTMVQLAFVQFFSWFALFAMWIYTTAAVTSHVYDLALTKENVGEFKQVLVQVEQETTTKFANYPDKSFLAKLFEGDEKGAAMHKISSIKDDVATAEAKFENKQEKVTISPRMINFFRGDAVKPKLQPTTSSRLDMMQSEYNKGGDWVGVCFAVYNGFSAFIALFIPMLSRLINRKLLHSLALAIGGLGLISIFFITNENMLLLSMLGIGIVWSSILTIPYSILSGALPQDKMGIYMGIFNFFIVIPQIIAAGVLGFMVKTFFDNEAIYALVVGGVSMFIAAILVSVVKDNQNQNI
jgi:maltose/moltooligosaccharide transporter